MIMQMPSDTLPAAFVWTRYGTESGESIEDILVRKERERLSCGGMFLWGIGNSIAPSVRQLLISLSGNEPVVIFSPMLSAPRKQDASPTAVVEWHQARGIDGRDWAMPSAATVFSRANAGSATKLRHYALVCRSSLPLAEDLEAERFSIGDLRNFASGAVVGHSQVTAVVRRLAPSGIGSYPAAIRAVLTYPYVLELYGAGLAGTPAPSVARRMPEQLELTASV
jgi:hypothetical protein